MKHSAVISKTLFTLVAALLVMISGASLFAATEPNNQQPLDELITTLESETGRQELIAQLKTLRQARAESHNEANGLVEWLKIDDQSSALTAARSCVWRCEPTATRPPPDSNAHAPPPSPDRDARAVGWWRW